MNFSKSIIAAALSLMVLVPAQAKSALPAKLPADLTKMSPMDEATLCGVIMLRGATVAYADTQHVPEDRAEVVSRFVLRGTTWFYLAIEQDAPPGKAKQWDDWLQQKNTVLTKRHFSHCWEAGRRHYDQMGPARQEMVDELIGPTHERIRKSVQNSLNR